MAVREQARRVIALGWLGLLLGCRDPAIAVEPSERPPARPTPTLDQTEEALLASLIADDPGDFHGLRARLWRIGPIRWIADGPELGPRPSDSLRGGALEQPLEVVVVDADGPRVLLPLGDRSALRLVATVSPSDLLTGLTRELHPTQWLTLAAGVALTPREREDDHLRVHWFEPDCGFGLELAIDAADFGPLYEPGPSGHPTDEPEHDGATALRIAPGTQLFADPDGRQPIIRLDPEQPRESARLSAAQRVRLLGKPTRKLQAIELRCRGVTVTGYAPTSSIVELPGRFAIVEPELPPSSSCKGFAADPIFVPQATPLFEPETDRAPELVGVVTRDTELPAQPLADGWWRTCMPSPWGDLIADLRLR